MNGCTPRTHEADTICTVLSMVKLAGSADRGIRDRQAAVLYLKAATRADDPVAREVLRRRAARLLSPEADDGRVLAS